MWNFRFLRLFNGGIRRVKSLYNLADNSPKLLVRSSSGTLIWKVKLMIWFQRWNIFRVSRLPSSIALNNWGSWRTGSPMLYLLSPAMTRSDSGGKLAAIPEVHLRMPSRAFHSKYWDSRSTWINVDNLSPFSCKVTVTKLVKTSLNHKLIFNFILEQDGKDSGYSPWPTDVVLCNGKMCDLLGRGGMRWWSLCKACRISWKKA